MQQIRILRVQRYCDLAVCTLLIFTVMFRGGKSLESTWLLTGIACVCVLLQYFPQRRKKEKRFSIIWILLMLFTLWTGLSYLLSTTKNYGFDELLQTGGLSLLILWYLFREKENVPEDLPREKKQALSFEERFLSILAVLTILSSSIGVFVYILQPVSRFVGTFFDMRFHTDYWPNAYAEFLLLGWPLVLMWSEENSRRETVEWKRYLKRYLPLGFVLGCLLLSYSRGAFIAFIGQVILVMLLLTFAKIQRKGRRIFLKHLTASLLLAAFTFGVLNEARSLLHPTQSLGEKISFTAAEGTSSLSERKAFWKQAAILTMEKPLFGWGTYSFRFVQPRLQTSPLATSDHPHNVFLKLSMERGIFSALLFAALAVLAVLAGIRLSIKGERFSPLDNARIEYALLTTSVAGVLAHNLIDYNLQFAGISLPLWLLMAFLLKKTAAVRTQVKIHKKTDPQRIAALLGLLLLILTTREGVYLVTSSFGRHAEAAGRTEDATRWYERSNAEWFTRDLLLSQAHLELERGRTELALGSVERYLEKNREDARAWNLLGEIYAEQERFDESLTAYEEAFIRGSWNDLRISRNILEALFAETYAQPTSNVAADAKRLTLHPKLTEIAPIIEQHAFAFAEAIERNLHFSALSPNAEEAVRIFIALSVLNPERIEEYKESIEKIEKNSRMERERISARAPGWLW